MGRKDWGVQRSPAGFALHLGQPGMGTVTEQRGAAQGASAPQTRLCFRTSPPKSHPPSTLRRTDSGWVARPLNKNLQLCSLGHERTYKPPSGTIQRWSSTVDCHTCDNTNPIIGFVNDWQSNRNEEPQVRLIEGPIPLLPGTAAYSICLGCLSQISLCCVNIMYVAVCNPQKRAPVEIVW